MRAKENIMDTWQNGTSKGEVNTEDLADQRVCGEGLKNQPLLCSYVYIERNPPKLSESL